MALDSQVYDACLDKEAAAARGRDDVKDFFWMRCSCGKHFRLITIKAAHTDRWPLLCKVCKLHACKLSSWAISAAEVMDRSSHLWAYECRTLRGKFGAFDFVIPEYQLAIEVDGEHHYTEQGWGKGQRARDFRKVKEAERQGWKVLRVPYFHTDSFDAKLGEAVREAHAYPASHFVMWSTDIHNEFGCFARRGDTLEDWEDRWLQARANAVVSHPTLKPSCLSPRVPVRNTIV